MYLRDHHKAYYTYISMYIQKYIHFNMWYIGTGEKFWSTSNCIIFVIRRTVLSPGMCLWICTLAMMHHVLKGEAVVTSQKIDILC